MITFENVIDGSRVTIELDDDLTWHEVFDRFVGFLQVSGYQLTRDDILDYLEDTSYNSEEGSSCSKDCNSCDCMNDQNCMTAAPSTLTITNPGALNLTTGSLNNTVTITSTDASPFGSFTYNFNPTTK